MSDTDYDALRRDALDIKNCAHRRTDANCIIKIDRILAYFDAQQAAEKPSAPTTAPSEVAEALDVLDGGFDDAVSNSVQTDEQFVHFVAEDSDYFYIERSYIEQHATVLATITRTLAERDAEIARLREHDPWSKSENHNWQFCDHPVCAMVQQYENTLATITERNRELTRRMEALKAEHDAFAVFLARSAAGAQDSINDDLVYHENMHRAAALATIEAAKEAGE